MIATRRNHLKETDAPRPPSLSLPISVENGLRAAPNRCSALGADLASRRCDLVLDPFAGSGTTFIAAEKTGREASALEIDPTYADVIVQRWQSYTGRSALLAATGATFEELTEQRKPKAPSPAPADPGAR